MKIELTCAECGENQFTFPETGGDGAIITCKPCGHVIGTLGEVKDAVAKAVLSRSTVATVDHGAESSRSSI